MKVFTDSPDKFNSDQLVGDPETADVLILFQPASAGSFAGLGKPTYLVARRMPLLLANTGVNVRLTRPEDLGRILAGQEVGEQGMIAKRPEQLPEKVKNVIVSYSPGTNVGKTFIASNMAAWLALNGRKSVLLDLDMDGSGTWEILGMKEFFGEAPTISAWNGDPDGIKQTVEQCEHPRVKGMCFIKRGKTANATEVIRAVQALATQGYTVIIDTSNNQELPYIHSALRIAEKVFLVATLTLKLQTRLAEMYATAKSASGLVGKMVLCVNRVGYHEESGNFRPDDMARQFMFKRHYVVHENAKGRNTATKKKTPLVAVKSSLGKELTGMFESEFLDGGEKTVRK